YLDLGAIHDKFGRLEPAINAYTQALELDPDTTLTRVTRGRAYMAQQKNDRAAADFIEAIRRDPQDADAHAALGFVHATVKSPGDAQREALQSLLCIDRIHHASDYIVLHNVACIYAVLAQSDAANRTPYQDQAIDLLHRAKQRWQQRGNGPSEIDFIKGESAF